MAYKTYVSYTDHFMELIIIVVFRYDGISCTHWSGAEANMAGTMPLITARSSKEMLVSWEPILSSLLPDKFARVLFAFHSGRLESLDVPILPDDRSQFDVYCALEDDKVKQFKCLR